MITVCVGPTVVAVAAALDKVDVGPSVVSVAAALDEVCVEGVGSVPLTPIQTALYMVSVVPAYKALSQSDSIHVFHMRRLVADWKMSDG
jgi:hypothetical protein